MLTAYYDDTIIHTYGKSEWGTVSFLKAQSKQATEKSGPLTSPHTLLIQDHGQGQLAFPGLVYLDSAPCSSIPFWLLLSHQPFYLSIYLLRAPPASRVVRSPLGFSHQLLRCPFGFLPLFGNPWQFSRNVWAPPQDGGTGDSHLQALRGTTLCTPVPCTSSSPTLALTSLPLLASCPPSALR